MPNIYTLESGVITSTPATQKWFDENKNFYIYQSKTTKKLTFVNVETKSRLTTSPATIEISVNGYIKFRTQNSVIQVVLDEGQVLRHEKDYKPRHYGDGYEKHIYEFSTKISKEYFIDFCNKNHPYIMNDVNNDAWYENRVEISGEGRHWELKHILAYTD